MTQRTVMCAKFKKEMPGLENPPFGGEIGHGNLRVKTRISSLNFKQLFSTRLWFLQTWSTWTSQNCFGWVQNDNGIRADAYRSVPRSTSTTMQRASTIGSQGSVGVQAMVHRISCAVKWKRRRFPQHIKQQLARRSRLAAVLRQYPRPPLAEPTRAERRGHSKL